MDECDEHDKRAFALSAKDPDDEPDEIGAEVCILEWKVECKSHDDKGGDKEEEGACEYGSKELLLKLAGIIIASGGKGADKTDK